MVPTYMAIVQKNPSKVDLYQGSQWALKREELEQEEGPQACQVTKVLMDIILEQVTAITFQGVEKEHVAPERESLESLEAAAAALLAQEYGALELTPKTMFTVVEGGTRSMQRRL